MSQGQVVPNNVTPIIRLLTPEEAAERLGCSISFLQKDRAAARAGMIPWLRFGDRSVRYRATDIDRWIDKQLVVSTAEAA